MICPVDFGCGVDLVIFAGFLVCVLRVVWVSCLEVVAVVLDMAFVWQLIADWQCALVGYGFGVGRFGFGVFRVVGGGWLLDVRFVLGCCNIVLVCGFFVACALDSGASLRVCGRFCELFG